ncbi:hypothetical protein [Sutcliffiella cohnii]|uniref:hypothetical protein n=1 Tax=Sutcliffiella cohnii TaxID=33932 RepID=UPI002E251254|nr:hypothetical protein [Sutcliffiella cohnii]
MSNKQTVKNIIKKIQNYSIYTESFSYVSYELPLIDFINQRERTYTIETFFNDDDIYEGQMITGTIEEAKTVAKGLQENSSFVHDVYALGEELFIQTFFELHDLVNINEITEFQELINYLNTAPNVIPVVKKKEKEESIDDEILPF